MSESKIYVKSEPEADVNGETADVSVETPEASIETPEASVETPEVLVETAEVSVETPEASVETPEIPVETPPASVETPEVSVADSSIPVVEESDVLKRVTSAGFSGHAAGLLASVIESETFALEDLEERTQEHLKSLKEEQAVALLDEFISKTPELIGIVNPAAFFSTCVKALRDRIHQQGPKLGLSDPIIRLPNSEKLKELLARTGYNLQVTPGQRKYGGPPPDFDGPHPPAGTEAFIGRIPKELYEVDLIPIFETCGTLWEFRLMMDPVTGFNKTYAFATYVKKEDAKAAATKYDNYEVMPGYRLKVNVSIANTRLFVGNLPRQSTKEELQEEFSRYTEGLIEVVVYTPADPGSRFKNRGYAFLQFQDHKSASNSKRKLQTARDRPFNSDIQVDWAEPQSVADEETMSQVKVLYIRNLRMEFSEADLRKEFQVFGEIEQVKRIKDYGFVHFKVREDALKAMETLNGKELKGNACEIELAKPHPDRKVRMDNQGGYQGGGYGRGYGWGDQQRGGRGGSGMRGRGGPGYNGPRGGRGDGGPRGGRGDGGRGDGGPRGGRGDDGRPRGARGDGGPRGRRGDGWPRGGRNDGGPRDGSGPGYGPPSRGGYDGGYSGSYDRGSYVGGGGRGNDGGYSSSGNYNGGSSYSGGGYNDGYYDNNYGYGYDGYSGQYGNSSSGYNNNSYYDSSGTGSGGSGYDQSYGYNSWSGGSGSGGYGSDGSGYQGYNDAGYSGYSYDNNYNYNSAGAGAGGGGGGYDGNYNASGYADNTGYANQSSGGYGGNTGGSGGSGGYNAGGGYNTSGGYSGGYDTSGASNYNSSGYNYGSADTGGSRGRGGGYGGGGVKRSQDYSGGGSYDRGNGGSYTIKRGRAGF